MLIKFNLTEKKNWGAEIGHIEAYIMECIGMGARIFMDTEKVFHLVDDDEDDEESLEYKIKEKHWIQVHNPDIRAILSQMVFGCIGYTKNEIIINLDIENGYNFTIH